MNGRTVTVYLAVAISQKHEKYCREWRNTFKEHFSDEPRLKFIDPIEGKDLHKEYHPEEIYREDMKNIGKSDIILAEYMIEGYDHIGTLMELQEAYQQNMGIIVFGDKNRGHYFLEYIIDYWPHTMAEATENLKEMTLLNKDIEYL